MAEWQDIDDDGAIKEIKIQIELVKNDKNIPSLFMETPSIWACGNRELRHHTDAVMAKIKDNDWMVINYYRKPTGTIIDVDDFNMLSHLGYCGTTEQLIEVFSRWKRLGPNSVLVNALKTTVVNAKMGASSGYAQKVADFPRCDPSYQQDGSVRAVDFGDGVIRDAQLTLRGSAEIGFTLNGSLERVDPMAEFVLELPTGEIIDNFDEDGPVLNLRRIPLAAPIALLDVRVRRL